MILVGFRREKAALGAGALIAWGYVLWRVQQDGPGAEVRLGQAEWLVFICIALLVWILYPYAQSRKQARALRRSTVKPRAGWPGRRGLPEAETMRMTILNLIAAATITPRRSGAPLSPEDLVVGILMKRVEEYGVKEKNPIRLIEGLDTGRVFELWAIHQALTTEGKDNKAALKRLNNPKRYKLLRNRIAEARAMTAKYNEELKAYGDAMRDWQQEGSVKVGLTGLKGFLQSNAPADPALWHQVMCGLEPDFEHEAIVWMLKQPVFNAGGLACWLAQATNLGYLANMILRAERRGDRAFLETVGDVIAKSNIMHMEEPLWDHPEHSWNLSEHGALKSIERAWERQMAEVEEKLGRRPWASPMRLFAAPMKPCPEPTGKYRYSHSHGLTIAPPRREEFSSAA